MLVLNTRNEREIYIGENVTIHILGPDKIGVTADKSIRVLRGTVAERINENRQLHNSTGREDDSDSPEG